MKYLTDSKIKSLYFDFDANNILSSQDLILELEKLEEDLKKYTLRFVDVSSFKININVGNGSIYPDTYEADSMYVDSIIKLEEGENHEKWEIKLINEIGLLIIFSNRLELDKYSLIKVK